ncbi:MAG: glutamine synthetase [Candidatus Aminicenantes bacterium]|nr:glutamine synthetase [Candidatus Aminicenantes bacterium]
MEERKKFPLANPVSLLLDKEKEDFQRQDFLHLIELKQLEMITFHYVGLDGQIKDLKIPVTSRQQAESILAEGERVDGSSLYKGLVDAGLSDLYVIPVYRSAFLNPFNDKSLDFMCRFLDKEGKPVNFTLDNILVRAHQNFKDSSGLELWALGELEFFLLSEQEKYVYQLTRQRGYHASSPFLKSGQVLDEMVRLISQITGAVKYAHSEVGFVEKVESEKEEIHGKMAEQLEIEFLPERAEDAADHLVLAKWLIRNVAYRHGMVATFTPKLEDGVAGNGLHFHLELKREGKNVMTGTDGRLSLEARKLIGGLCFYADSLTAFGNTVAASYLRLVPHQEAPTRVCWSDLNRSAMIRVPLGWSRLADLARLVNPQENEPYNRYGSKQTVEIRTPDGSALIHLVLAGILMAADWALSRAEANESGKEAMELAEKLYVSGNIFADQKLLQSLQNLPGSCQASARILLEKRGLYERKGIFPPSIIDYVADMLNRENDGDLQQQLASLSSDSRLVLARRIMHRDLHKH